MPELWEKAASAARLLGEVAFEAKASLSTAESCTGGLVDALITEVPGASAWFDRGFVTYTPLSKTEMLDVPPEVIEHEGVVSEAVAHAMARGACARSRASYAVSLTGVAGPGGGTEATPVGTVCIGWAEKLRDGRTIITSARTIHVPSQSRSVVRLEAARVALQGLITLIHGEDPASMPCEY